MTDSIKVTGIKEVQRTLYAYSQQLGDRVVYGALRAGANVVLKQARANAPKGKTGNLKRGIVVMKSKINNGKRSPLLGMYITIKKKKKGDPFYGRFQEDGWNTHGKLNSFRQNFRVKSLTTQRSTNSSRITQRGKTNVPGKHFIDQAFIDKRAQAVEMIIRTSTAAADLLAKKVGL